MGQPKQNSTNSLLAPSATLQQWTNLLVATGRVGLPMQNSTNSLATSEPVGKPSQNSMNCFVASSSIVQKWADPLVASGRAGPPIQNSTDSLVASSATAQKWRNLFVASGRAGPPRQNSKNFSCGAVCHCAAVHESAGGYVGPPIRVRRILLWRCLPLCRTGQILLRRVDAWASQCRI